MLSLLLGACLILSVIGSGTGLALAIAAVCLLRTWSYFSNSEFMAIPFTLYCVISPLWAFYIASIVVG